MSASPVAIPQTSQRLAYLRAGHTARLARSQTLGSRARDGPRFAQPSPSRCELRASQDGRSGRLRAPTGSGRANAWQGWRFRKRRRQLYGVVWAEKRPNCSSVGQLGSRRVAGYLSCMLAAWVRSCRFIGRGVSSSQLGSDIPGRRPNHAPATGRGRLLDRAFSAQR